MKTGIDNIQTNVVVFIWSIVIQIMSQYIDLLHGLNARTEKTITPVPEVPACRVLLNAEEYYSVFCNSEFSNESSLAMPLETSRLQIYQQYNLSIEDPLVHNLDLLKILELPGNKLKKISNIMLGGMPNLKTIILENNLLKELPADVFINNPYLEVIDLSANLIICICNVSKSFRQLIYLKEINLSENVILGWISNEDFLELNETNLETLDLSGCYILRIDSEAFAPLKHISALDISFNPVGSTALINLTHSMNFKSVKKFKASNLHSIRYFPMDVFRALNSTGIEFLDVSHNMFLGFPSIYYFFPELKTLDLTSCDIYEILPGAFDNMANLETLILRTHQLLYLNRELFNLKNLKMLDLSDYVNTNLKSVFTITNYAFQNQKHLEVLLLKELPIREPIRRYTLYGLVNLKEMRFTRGVISVIEDYSFETLENLLTLDLSWNSIETLSNGTLYGLKNVEIINLKSNYITFFNSSNPFQHTTNLQSIQLNGNKISQLPSGIFYKLSNIGVIEMSDNFIIPWNDPILPRHKNMTILRIARNVITYFTPAMLEDVKQLEFLDFRYNPLNCTVCGMKDLQMWIRNTSTAIYQYREVGYESSDPYNCLSPQNLEGHSLFEVTIPITHCLPVEVNVLLLLCTTLVPLLACSLIVILVWYRWSWNIKYYWFHIKLDVKKYKEQVKVDDYKYDAFVSYCQDDIKWVRNELVPALEESEPKLRLCLSDRNFDAGAYITDNVIASIQQSRTTILVLSNGYMESHWCKFDFDMAQHKLFEDTRSGLILVWLEDIEKSRMTKNLKYVLRTRTCIPWTDNPVGQKLFRERLRFAIAKPEDKAILKHIT